MCRSKCVRCPHADDIKCAAVHFPDEEKYFFLQACRYAVRGVEYSVDCYHGDCGTEYGGAKDFSVGS